jgi:hypothetical protein
MSDSLFKDNIAIVSYYASITMQFLTRALTIVLLLMLLTVVAQFKACMTPQQLPAGVGVPPSAQSQPDINPKGQAF